MMGIRLHNSATRAKEDFVPIDASNVRMYVCGPTVYDRAHIGNARPVVVFDTLYRLLRHVYGEAHVTYVRNFTDVDDKINATAQARKAAGDARPLEALIRERTEETIGWYHADMDALGALRPKIEPRATDYIGQMVAMIAGLIAGGHAYAKEGHVLFRVRSYAEYGRLSGRSVDDMIAGARVEVAPFKEDPMDFVLWKPSDADLPGWESPWGRGRPGWHIECSAMAHELLGAEFDIHGGGLDLQFPHHENEIAQSCCAGHGFARVWMHNEMLQVEGKKMSKSLGNFFTVRDLLEKGVPGEVIRIVFLGTHYGKPMDWTAEKAAQAEATLRKWRGLVAGIDPAPTPLPGVVAALSDDLNTAGALAECHAAAGRGDYAGLLASARVMGLLTEEMGEWARGVDLSGLAAKLSTLREAAKASKDFAPVDALKSALLAAGVEVRMSKDGVELMPGAGFDATKLEAL
ncbi:cysteine--tRNA ligase [Stagnihabitans tardus]|uniref:Cysteine--tRNA ligase n=1 Tax=Stagnihabitans tardus TaxID=2699202 RepID=A0AAE4YC50_9RHOB|nr:cysteine--tRNA ligase [Stagnihabitans tardus]